MASSVCYVTYNYAMKIIGEVKTGIYLYLMPAVTVITAFFVLGEHLSFLAIG